MGTTVEETLNDVNNMLLKSSRKKEISGMHDVRSHHLCHHTEVMGGTLWRRPCYCHESSCFAGPTDETFFKTGNIILQGIEMKTK